jgi:ribosomal protein S26
VADADEADTEVWATINCDACGGAALVVLPGTENVHEYFLLIRGIPRRNYCMDCAIARGWPWLKSEEAAKRKEAR